MHKKKLIAYASYFVSFLINQLNDEDLVKIERISLFGSVAKGEATKESDIDIFIEIKKNGKIKKELINLTKRFYESREATLFKAQGIDNKINIKIGKLKEWQDLYKSIASTGILLYSPYEARELPSGTKHFIIFYWDKIEKNRGAFLNKLYGFCSKSKSYPGLLEKWKGKKIGKSCILIPIVFKKDMFELIKKYKVSASIQEVFV